MVENNLFTVYCEHCHKNFNIPYSQRDKRLCEKCKSKTNSQCLICKKEFTGDLVCSKECNIEYLSNLKIIENNPNWNNLPIKKCEYCDKEFGETLCEKYQNKTRKYCSVSCRNHTKNYSLKIKNKKDCFLCDKNGRMHKGVVLCSKCHKLTSKNKSFWELVFTILLSSSRIVPKVWGAEVHIINSVHYCLKYLIFFKDCYFSNHWHQIKQELWHCLIGDFEMLITDENGETISTFSRGDKIEIKQGVIHQLFAKQDSILVEVSTQHFNEDSHYKISAL